jgi:hypothetical protein
MISFEDLTKLIKLIETLDTNITLITLKIRNKNLSCLETFAKINFESKKKPFR